jgi:DivIVA domain-containing protein
MPFAAHEIEQKKFVVALRGYQTDEVEAFLRAVAADYRAALADVDHARDEAREAANRPEAELAELRLAAETEADEIRAQARRDAHEIREAAYREAEAAYDEITRRAEELRRLEESLWMRMHSLEHTVVECRQALTHVSNVHPMQPAAAPPLPTVDELLYRVEESLGTETKAALATADL